MKYIFILSFLFFTTIIFAQNKKMKFKWNVGAGYQDGIGPIKFNNAIPYDGFSLGNPVTTSGAFLDLGIEIDKEKNHFGLGVRMAQSGQWNSETFKENFLIEFLPRAWYSYYFGKNDKRGFRADLSIILDWQNESVMYDPVNPSDIPNTSLYVCFGPQVGTRIIRKGAFANTYLTGGPVFAPPVKFDSYIVANPSWNIRWMFGLSKSLSFKKSSK